MRLTFALLLTFTAAYCTADECGSTFDDCVGRTIRADSKLRQLDAAVSAGVYLAGTVGDYKDDACLYETLLMGCAYEEGQGCLDQTSRAIAPNGDDVFVVKAEDGTRMEIAEACL